MTIPRRAFLAAGAALTTVGCSGVLRLAAEAENGSVTIPRAQLTTLWTDGAPAVVALGAGAGSIVLWPLEDGGVRAIGATCTHLGCDVRPSGEFLLCPCHGSTFAADGRVLRGPATRPLPVHPVAIAEDAVTIQLTHARTVL